MPDDEPQQKCREGRNPKSRKLIGVQHDSAQGLVDMRGVGPRPGMGTPVVSPLLPGRFQPRTLMNSVTTSHCARLGSRTSSPIVPDHPRVHGRFGEPAQQHPVQQQTQRRRENEDADQQRRHDGQADAGVELVVEVGRGERDRSVGKVEDSRGGVREHQPGGHHRIDGAGDQP